jgi:hypothetical protein
MKKPSYIADIIVAVSAFGIALLLALLLHTKWYYGAWISWFGDPPSSNPAYGRFVYLFNSFPYLIAGLVGGIIAGFGYPNLMRITIRTGGIIAIFLVLLTRNHHLTFFSFVPTASIAFFISTIISAAYFRLYNQTP